MLLQLSTPVLDTADRLDKGMAASGYRFQFAVACAVIAFLIGWVIAIYRAQGRRADRQRAEDKADAKGMERAQLLVIEAARSLDVLGTRLQEKWDAHEVEDRATAQRWEEFFRERLAQFEDLMRERLPAPKPPRGAPMLGPEPRSNPGRVKP